MYNKCITIYKYIRSIPFYKMNDSIKTAPKYAEDATFFYPTQKQSWASTVKILCIL